MILHDFVLLYNIDMDIIDYDMLTASCDSNCKKSTIFDSSKPKRYSSEISPNGRSSNVEAVEVPTENGVALAETSIPDVRRFFGLVVNRACVARLSAPWACDGLRETHMAEQVLEHLRGQLLP